MTTKEEEDTIQRAPIPPCSQCGHPHTPQEKVGQWIWSYPEAVHLDDSILVLCMDCHLQGFVFWERGVAIWPKSRADTPTNTQSRCLWKYNPWDVQPEQEVLSEFYHQDCSRCWLGHGHTFAQHYEHLVFQALRQKFGDHYNWTSEKERAMHEYEIAWWKVHVPFPWKKEYRQVGYWNVYDD